MQTQKEKIIKRKKKRYVMLQLEEENIIYTEKELREKLRRIFKNHIGKENSISPYDLFYNIFNIMPENVDFYKRSFLWDEIKRILRMMRSDLTLFVVNRGSLYVLKTEDELKNYKVMIDNDIKALKKNLENARIWIDKEKWKSF